jgi:hypothetical protein
MKKTLMTTAVLFALGASFGASAQLVPPTVVPGNSDRDDQFGALDNTLVSRGVVNIGAQNPSPNTPVNSYSPILNDSLNSSLTNAYNDVNSGNNIDIAEDGNVAFAQDLDQAIAEADMSHTVGNVLSTLPVGLGGNYVTENSVLNVGAQNPAPNTSLNNDWVKTNTIEAGAFNNYGGLATTNQNLGSTTSVGQAVVVQSNGSI